MALAPEQKARLGRIVGRSVARLIKSVYRTSTLAIEPPDGVERLAASHPMIMATWHGQFMMLVAHRPDVPTAAMVARHGDAELIGEAMQSFGIELVRGAGAGERKKDRGGAAALRVALKLLAQNKSIVMTADVPPGPARRAGEGIVTLGRLSGRPIVPVAAATSRFKVLNTWSRMTINLPYSKLTYAVGQPIFVPRDADEAALEHARQTVESELNAMTARAYQMAGADIKRIAPALPPNPDDPPSQTGPRLKLYRAATAMMQPAAALLLGIRERQGKEDPSRRRERMGVASVARPDGPLAWIHAASVGETNAVLPLIDRLRTERPELSFLLTTGTVTSAGLAAQRLGSRAIHQYVPLDTPAFARKFIAHWRPDLALFTESEVWPNLILETGQQSIPIVLVNGRMSNRSYSRWRKNPGLSAPLFNRFRLVLAQNEKLARRFSELGARKVVDVGNLKIDSPPPPIEEREFEKLAEALRGRTVLVAASTHEGEEDIVAAAHRLLGADVEGLLTIIAPRHPERGAAVAKAVKARGLSTMQRSTGALPDAATSVYVADTIGELGMLYKLAVVAFIGGSLVEHGGQNPIEAIRQGAAVLTGPSWQNFADAYGALLRRQAVREVSSAAEIAAAVRAIIRDPETRRRMQENAQATLETLSGALDRTVEALLPLLPPSRGELPGPAEDAAATAEGLLRAS